MNDIGWVAYQEISYTFILWVSIVVSCVSVVFGFVHTKDLRQIIRRCEQVDDTLESFSVKREYTKFFWSVVRIIPIWILTMFCLYAVDTYWMTDELGVMHGIRLCFLVHVPFTVNSMVILSFCTFMRVLKDKLRKLNVAMCEVSRLSNAANDVEAKYVKHDSRASRKIVVAMNYVNRKRVVQHFLQTSRHVHLEIVRISDVLNGSYCYQLLLELVVEFTLIIGLLYNVYFELMKLNSPSEIWGNKGIAAMSFWLLMNVGKIVAVNNFCTALHNEATVTGQYLRELEGSYSDENIRDEMQQFSMQLVLHPLCFSAGGFVYLNNRLTKMFFGTIMTYMAILVQMSSTPTAIRSLTQVVND
ncbi:uncharacterized protein LOC108632145 [Ceratina calcarata]|uniref:Gustatory receptor n=1 Tax=Ceratina calcarata TaxID=156304 RepID=A0AAJ7JG46_9HYME|nr:uncharacterized protein LOC108632145 [Ceratina calcarata]